MNEKTLKKNLEALAKTDPHLAQKIKDHQVDKETFQLVKSKNNKHLNLTIQNKRFMYYDPANIILSVNKDLESVKALNPKLTIFLGFGLGYHFMELVGKKYYQEKIKKILIIEKDLSILKAGLSIVDLSELFVRPKFIKIIADEKIEDLYLRIYDFTMDDHDIKLFSKALCVVPAGGALGLDKDYYINAVKHLREAINQSIVNYGNSPEDSLIGLENMLGNIRHTLENPGIKKLVGKFQGKPAILVAAGPSLQKNIHLLHELKDKAFIICVDTALKILLRNNIYPHMVTAIERGISVMNYFDKLEDHKEKLQHVYYAPATILRPEIFDKCLDEYSMKSAIVYRKFAHYEWLGVDKGIIHSGKSGANLAFNILTHLGFDTIILMGQDLAFGEDDKTHIDGADHSIKGMKSSYKIKETMYVKGNFVDKIKTIKTWHMFLRFYEKDIAEFDGTVINATEGGAYIHGTKLMTLSEAADTYLNETFDSEKLIDSYMADFSKEEAIQDVLTVKDVMEKTLEFVDGVIEKCDNGMQRIEQFKEELQEKTEGESLSFTELDGSWLNSVAKELFNLKKEIGEDRMFYLFMMHIVQSFVIKAEIEYNALPSIYKHYNDQNAAYIKIMSEWFPTMKGLTEVSKKYLEKAYADLLELEKKYDSNNNEIVDAPVVDEVGVESSV